MLRHLFFVCTLFFTADNSSAGAPASQNKSQIQTVQTHAEAHSIDEQTPESLSCRVSNLIEESHSLWLKCFLIFLLGLLLSFTPCIYPMIPVTIGILQGQGSSSFWKNLIVATSYTMGIATTFALLGTVAAYTGRMFGSFMQHPLVIFSLVALLVYLAGSMLGFYNMYTPLALTQTKRIKGGSAFAAFCFGMISGTVASPCVSPGLALVLSIVTKLAHPFLGFLLLFAFGVGLSMPLLIIGTFSSSVAILPKAGQWMVAIKELFGFLMLGMSLYFLNTIIPTYITLTLLTALLFVMGIYYQKAAKKYRADKGRTLGFILISLCSSALYMSSVIVGYYALRAAYHPHDCTVVGLWTKNYLCAQTKAEVENKYLLVKFDAPCCSMCKAIEKKFFYNDEITKVLEQLYIPVHIDGAQTTDPTVSKLLEQFLVIGFPTIVIVDPKNQAELQRWTSELYDYSVDAFKNVLLFPTSSR